MMIITITENTASDTTPKDLPILFVFNAWSMHKRCVTIHNMGNKFYVGLSIGAACIWLFTGCGQKEPVALPVPEVEVAEEQVMDMSKTNELAQDTALNNPATVYCLQAGGEFIMKKTLDGATEGFCALPNNITCEVWAHYQGDCPTKQPAEKDDVTRNDAEETLNPEKDELKPEAVDQDPADKSQLEPDVLEDPADEKPAENKLEISVEAGEDAGELITTWKTNGLKATEGFYVMLSGEEKIEHPAKYSHELKNSQSRSFIWTGLSPQKTYYFRVCIIEKGDCKHYSPVASGIIQ